MKVFWTEADDYRLIALWNDGLSVKAIAACLRVTPNQISGRSHRLIKKGVIKPRGSPLKPKGERFVRPLVAYSLSHQKRMRQEMPAAFAHTLPPLASLVKASVPCVQEVCHVTVTAEPARLPEHVLMDGGVALAAPSPSRPVRQKAPEPPKPKRPLGECQFPIGEPKAKDFRFCGLPTQENSPYCPEHTRLCRVRIRDLREAGHSLGAEEAG